MNADKFPTNDRPPTPRSAAPDLLLSLATGPLLVGLVAQKVVTAAVREIGQWSEEVFRGDRLPILNFPEVSNDTDTAKTDQA